MLFTLFTMNLADFGTPIVIGGNFKVLATEAYTQVISTANLDGPPPSDPNGSGGRRGLLFLLPEPEKNESAGGTDRNAMDGEPAYTLTGAVAGAAWTVTGMFFLVMALKYGNIFLSAFSNTASGSLTFTLDYFGKLPRSQWNSFGHSLVYSAVAAAVSAFLGILLSYYTHRRKIAGMRTAEFFASFPISSRERSLAWDMWRPSVIRPCTSAAHRPSSS